MVSLSLTLREGLIEALESGKIDKLDVWMNDFDYEVNDQNVVSMYESLPDLEQKSDYLRSLLGKAEEILHKDNWADKVAAELELKEKDVKQSKSMFLLMSALQKSGEEVVTVYRLLSIYNQKGRDQFPNWKDTKYHSLARAVNTLYNNKYVIKNDKKIQGPDGSPVTGWILIKKDWDGVVAIPSETYLRRLLKAKAALEEKIVNSGMPEVEHALTSLQACFAVCAETYEFEDLQIRIKELNEQVEKFHLGIGA